MIALITSVICLIVLGSSCGAFFVGQYISSVIQKNELLETNNKEMLEHIENLEEAIIELQRDNDILRKEDKRPHTPFTNWDPGDPLNSVERR